MSSELADRLTEVDVRQRASAEVTPRTDSLFDLVKRMEPQFRVALPKMVDPGRFVRLALTTLRTVPKLLECSPESVMAGFMQAAQFGVEIGGVRDQAHLIPRWNGKTKRMEANFQLGYRGLIDIAGRSDVTVRVRSVCDNDEFEVDDGFPPVLTHKPYLKGPRGDAYAYFCIATWADGRAPEFLVMGRPEVEDVRDKFGHKDRSGKIAGPWVDHFDAMAYKTLIIRLLNYLPLPVEVIEAINAADVPLDVRETLHVEPTQPEIEAKVGEAISDVASHVEELERDLDQQAAVDRSAGSETAGWSAAAEAVTTEPAAYPIAQAHIDAMASVASDGTRVDQITEAMIPVFDHAPDETVQQHAGRLITTLPEHRYDAWSAYVRRTGISVNPDRWSDDQARGVLDFVLNEPVVMDE